jgi:predicted metallo-beta-lactamase superfamily hydrolase
MFPSCRPRCATQCCLAAARMQTGHMYTGRVLLHTGHMYTGRVLLHTNCTDSHRCSQAVRAERFQTSCQQLMCS